MRGDAFARQLKLLALLEVRPQGVELDEAASELGARRRTIYRDFRVLEDAGVPLTSARDDGRRARWRIMPGYRHRLQLSLSWPELVALMTARQTVAGLAGTMLHDGVVSIPIPGYDARAPLKPVHPEDRLERRVADPRPRCRGSVEAPPARTRARPRSPVPRLRCRGLH